MTKIVDKKHEPRPEKMVELTDGELDVVCGGGNRKTGNGDVKFIYHGSDTTGKFDKKIGP